MDSGVSETNGAAEGELLSLVSARATHTCANKGIAV